MSFLGLAGLLLAGVAWAQTLGDQSLLDGNTRRQVIDSGVPSRHQPHLGLLLRDGPGEGGGTAVVVAGLRPGPVQEAGTIRQGDAVLALNDEAIRSAAEFRRALQQHGPGEEVLLRTRRGGSDASGGGSREETVALRVGSRAEWASPIDWVRPAAKRVAPLDPVKGDDQDTALEQFVFTEVGRHGIRQPIRSLLDYFAETADKFYGANMLSRVAHGFYHPTRLAELQASIADPLVRGVEQSGADKWSVGARVLAEAARNLDVRIPQTQSARIDLANPRQALQEAATLVAQSHSQLRLAFEGLTPAARTELETSLPLLLRPMRWLDAPVVRARQASMHVDYGRLFASASVMTSWTVSGDPPASVPAPATIPGELAGAVKGAVTAVERIAGRWYVYGGPGANEYDMSRIDIVIDPGGDDVYRYPRDGRPRIQLILDWSGNDVYTGADGAAGPASAMLGVSILVDREGNDRYEGGFRSCGAGLMGIGLLLDHGGNDTYTGTNWSLGAGFYGFGAIVDLGSGADVYTAQQFSEAIGGPRGFGLILDEAGRDLYRANGPAASTYATPGVFSAFSQGVGFGHVGLDTGGIGLLCDLAGNDRYEAGEYGQGVGFGFALGILYDRSGNDLYYGNVQSQASGAHGGIGILADDAGDDTYWAMRGSSQGAAWDISAALLLDRAGNDSYQSESEAQGSASMQSIAWLVDLNGSDRYVSSGVAQGESAGNRINFQQCVCLSWSLLLDAGGTTDFYSRAGRGDGVSLAPGRPAAQPENSFLHGVFIDTKERTELRP